MTIVKRTIHVDVPPEQVWAVLADFGGVSRWSPSVDHSVSTTELAAGVGAERACQVPGMGGITEIATEWEEGSRLAVDVQGAPFLKTMHAAMSVRADGTGTIAEAEADFSAKFGPLGALMAALMMKRKLGQTLAQTLVGLKHYAETGEPLLAEDAAAAADAASAGA